MRLLLRMYVAALREEMRIKSLRCRNSSTLVNQPVEFTQKQPKRSSPPKTPKLILCT